MILSKGEIKQQFDELSKLLLEKRNANGYWEGRLSSSARCCRHGFAFL
jgi:hypothetical protein